MPTNEETTTSDDGKFPVEWNAWERQYRYWVDENELAPTRKFIKGKNFLADAVMGTYKVPAGIVELSAVTFPDLGSGNPERKVRYVGITWRRPDQSGVDGGPGINGGLVETWDELESQSLSVLR